MRKGLILLVLVLALIATGCFCADPVHLTGGGWIDASDDEGLQKATFGFNVKCEGWEAKGHVTYHDPAAELKVKGVVTDCGNGYAEGWYVPQGKTDPKFEGEFRVSATDEGEPGVFDKITIKLYDGEKSMFEDPIYEVEDALLLGGNIQDHMLDD